MSCAIALWIALTPVPHLNNTLIKSNEAQRYYSRVQCEQFAQRAGYEQWHDWRRTPMPTWSNGKKGRDRLVIYKNMQYVTCIPCENQAEHKARLYNQLPPFKLPSQLGLKFTTTPSSEPGPTLN